MIDRKHPSKMLLMHGTSPSTRNRARLSEHCHCLRTLLSVAESSGIAFYPSAFNAKVSTPFAISEPCMKAVPSIASFSIKNVDRECKLLRQKSGVMLSFSSERSVSISHSRRSELPCVIYKQERDLWRNVPRMTFRTSSQLRLSNGKASKHVRFCSLTVCLAVLQNRHLIQRPVGSRVPQAIQM